MAVVTEGGVQAGIAVVPQVVEVLLFWQKAVLWWWWEQEVLQMSRCRWRFDQFPWDPRCLLLASFKVINVDHIDRFLSVNNVNTSPINLCYGVRSKEIWVRLSTFLLPTSDVFSPNHVPGLKAFRLCLWLKSWPSSFLNFLLVSLNNF